LTAFAPGTSVRELAAFDDNATPTMLPENPRIFLGTADTAAALSALAEGFRANGCATTTMVKRREVYSPHTHYDVVRGRELLRLYGYESGPRLVRGVAWRLDAALDLALNGFATPSYLNHDVFIFILEPWAPRSVLFPLLKRLGKKIVVYYLGSDVRHVSAYSQEYGMDTTHWGPAYNHDPLDRKIQRLRWGELYADLVYSVPDQSGLQIRPYYHAYAPVDVDLQPRVPSRKIPKVLHAPSRPEIKGTSFVLQAVEQLRREGLEFEFQLLTGVPRTEVLAAVSTSDIVVDELFVHGPAALSAEAMAAGAAVATRIIEPAFPFFDPPVCPVRPDTVTAGLRRLITDLPYRVELAARGTAWRRSAFDPKLIAARILGHLAGEGSPQYSPSFYLSSYRPPAALSRLSRELSRRVAERFRPQDAPALEDAATRGVVARPAQRRTVRAPDLSRPDA
jgi:hypothetical protein